MHDQDRDHEQQQLEVLYIAYFFPKYKVHSSCKSMSHNLQLCVVYAFINSSIRNHPLQFLGKNAMEQEEMMKVFHQNALVFP